MEIEEFDFEIPDVGGIDIPDLNMEDFDFFPQERANTENRYLKPLLVPMRTEQVMYENAEQLAKTLRIETGVRYDCLVSGSFIFGDFIEAFFTTTPCHTSRLVITTLSLSQENIDSFRTLLELGYVDSLDLVVSHYFYSHERNNLIPYMHKELDGAGYDFQLSVAFVHTKTVHFETDGGEKIVIHGSANLRSSGNVEQFTIEENAELYDFYEAAYSPIIEKFKTINKAAPRKQQWNDMQTKKFND